MKGIWTIAVVLAVVLAGSYARGQERGPGGVALMPPVSEMEKCNFAAVSLGRPVPAQAAAPACDTTMPDTNAQPRSFRKAPLFPQNLGPAQFRLSIDGLTVD